MTSEHLDVLIIGAGVSGIDAAAQLGLKLPDKTYALLEARDVSGGTWDLFRYPGIRSDSDMFTFGYGWEPWPSEQSLASGPEIVAYLRDVAKKYGVEEHTRYNHKVTAADWSSTKKLWTVTVETPEGTKEFTCTYLWSCSGYYDYDEGYQPVFPGREDFKGTFVHPQLWPEDLDYRGKKVVVIGSGATAVTLLPAMADDTAHITMLQRTPTYVYSRPGRDPLAHGLGATLGLVPRFVPFRRLREGVSFEAIRWANIGVLVGSYQLFQRQPELAKKIIRRAVISQLTARKGGKGMTKAEAAAYADVHFNPPYNPWDQRLCAVPDGDLFKVIREGKASVVTDHIKKLVKDGIELKSGQKLEADIIVSATGLKIKIFGDVNLTIDGKPRQLNKTVVYKGVLLADVPNLFFTIGYTNASWTLKADLVSDYATRVIADMDARGAAEFMVPSDPTVETEPYMDMRAGYLMRGVNEMPLKGTRGKWRAPQNYFHDLRVLNADIHDDVEVQYS